MALIVGSAAQPTILNRALAAYRPRFDVIKLEAASRATPPPIRRDIGALLTISQEYRACDRCRARTPGTRTHTEPPITSLVTQTLPRRRPQNHPRRATHSNLPRRAARQLAPFRRSFEIRLSQRQERSCTRKRAPLPLAHRAGHRPALGKSGRPQRDSARTAVVPRRLTRGAPFPLLSTPSLFSERHCFVHEVLLRR